MFVKRVAANEFLSILNSPSRAKEYRFTRLPLLDRDPLSKNDVLMRIAIARS